MGMSEPIVEPLVEDLIDPIIRVVPNYIPPPDMPNFFTGEGTKPAWEEVAKWAIDNNILHKKPVSISDQIGPIQVRGETDSAIGQSVKALSGFINRSVQLSIDLARALQIQAAIKALPQAVENFLRDVRIMQLEGKVALLEGNAIPALMAEIAHLRHDAQTMANAASLQAIDYITENQTKPILHTIDTNSNIARLQAATAQNNATDVAKVLHVDAILHAATALAPVATAVAGIAKDVEECLVPMCETMGPKTDLGKLLKALKIAEWALIIAELAALKAGGLDELLDDIQRWGATAIRDFESVFFEGGKSLGAVITGIG